MGWFSREAQVVEHTVVRVGEEEVEKIARRVAAILLKELRTTSVVLLEAALVHLDPSVEVVRKGA